MKLDFRLKIKYSGSKYRLYNTCFTGRNRLYNTCFTGRNIDYTILVLQEEIESNITLLKEKDREIKEALQKVENQDKLDIDEAVITTTPLYRQ